MDKKSKEVIKEVIETLWKDRDKLRQKNQAIAFELQNNRSLPEEEKQKLRRQLQIYKLPSYDKDIIVEQMIKLNSLLEVKEKNQEVLEIEKEMAKLQAKKYITVKQFTEIYGYSSDWQKNRRGRIHDPLPSRQDGHNKKITYVVSDIETWFENNNIGR